MVDVGYREAERKLERWGKWSKGAAERLGLPAMSGIARMIEQVKVFEQKQRGVKRKALRAAKQSGDPKRIAQALGNAAPDEPMAGKQTQSITAPQIGEVSSEVMQIEAIVRGMAGDMQAVIYRSYLFGQSDSRAAQNLRIRKVRYQERREAAVEYVAERLAVRENNRL